MRLCEDQTYQECIPNVIGSKTKMASIRAVLGCYKMLGQAGQAGQAASHAPVKDTSTPSIDMALAWHGKGLVKARDPYEILTGSFKAL